MIISAEKAKELTKKNNRYSINRVYNIISFGIYSRATKGINSFCYKNAFASELNDIKSYFEKQGYQVEFYRIDRNTYNIYFYW